MYTFMCMHYSVCPIYRVLDEISEVLGDRKFVTAEDIEQLQYMEQVYTCTLTVNIFIPKEVFDCIYMYT